jgi:hypothetical protein
MKEMQDIKKQTLHNYILYEVQDKAKLISVREAVREDALVG